MKGVIFNIFEDFICDNFGEEALDKIVARSDLQTKDPFVGPKFYPDEDLLALVGSACEVAKIEAPDALRAFGRYIFPKLKAQCPVSLKHIYSAPQLLSVVDKVIHVEVKKLSPQALLPEFAFQELEDYYALQYTSQRKFCPLVEGMLLAIGDAFETPTHIDKLSCLNKGDACCGYHLRFGAKEVAA